MDLLEAQAVSVAIKVIATFLPPFMAYSAAKQQSAALWILAFLIGLCGPCIVTYPIMGLIAWVVKPDSE